MSPFHLFYLRLVLAQGLCLAVGFWLHFQVHADVVNSVVLSKLGEERSQVLRQISSSNVKANTVAFLGSWGLLAGITGMLLLREQRDRLEAVLKEHDQPAGPELTLFNSGNDESSSDARRAALASVQGRPQLRLAAGDDDLAMDDDADFASICSISDR
ncbi:hypothetical protein SH661x_003380 [Planctomicrobium sp. SH661]|uniref:hypothetical protein n=1 Tax=Planctomicrobium sp. SH661 TaxID=3448124 RepID=UPI003F5BA193